MYVEEQQREKNIQRLIDEFGGEGLTREILTEICDSMNGDLADTSFVAMLRAELIAQQARRQIHITINRKDGD